MMSFDTPVPVPGLELASRSRPWRERLVAAFVAQGSLRTPALREAFLRVPREAWISASDEPVPSAGHPRHWQRCEAGQGQGQEAQEQWAAWRSPVLTVTAPGAHEPCIKSAISAIASSCSHLRLPCWRSASQGVQGSVKAREGVASWSQGDFVLASR
ncbi:MAG: hypothetical protein IRZ31_19240 [Thermogemmatispora sp.]|uniref:hypothetical protein n=1 Tax=Thermogemmatispora sp. TaxID=1968838 RepID=UPI00261CBED2|nr:hypothetical protein [Thermogemmatispora sp.]MBX5459034.1 hypothetical protein [Thermogemmatispora sp.]